MSTIIKCYNCEVESVFEKGEKVKKCKFCKSNIVMETLSEATKVKGMEFLKAQINLKNALAAEVDPGNQGQLKMALGLLGLSNRGYVVAKQLLNEAFNLNNTNCDAKYYYLIALMEGKRPYILSKTIVEEVMQSLDYLIALQPCAKYFYLKALIIKDYYNRNYIYLNDTPEGMLEYAKMLGLTQNDIDEVRAAINM